MNETKEKSIIEFYIDRIEEMKTQKTSKKNQKKNSEKTRAS